MPRRPAWPAPPQHTDAASAPASASASTAQAELAQAAIEVLQKRVANLQAVATSVRKDSEKKINRLEAECFRLKQAASHGGDQLSREQRERNQLQKKLDAAIAAMVHMNQE